MQRELGWETRRWTQRNWNIGQCEMRPMIWICKKTNGELAMWCSDLNYVVFMFSIHVLRLTLRGCTKSLSSRFSFVESLSFSMTAKWRSLILSLLIVAPVIHAETIACEGDCECSSAHSGETCTLKLWLMTILISYRSNHRYWIPIHTQLRWEEYVQR